MRATLAKMAGTNILNPETINLEFWSSWPRRFYNIRAYDMTKQDFEDMLSGLDHLDKEDVDNWNAPDHRDDETPRDEDEPKTSRQPTALIQPEKSKGKKVKT